MAQLNAKQGPVAQRITRWTTNPEIAGSNPARFDFFFSLSIFLPFSSKNNEDVKIAPPGGLEPPTFRLTAERASQLRHGGRMEHGALTREVEGPCNSRLTKQLSVHLCLSLPLWSSG